MDLCFPFLLPTIGAAGVRAASSGGGGWSGDQPEISQYFLQQEAYAETNGSPQIQQYSWQVQRQRGASKKLGHRIQCALLPLRLVQPQLTLLRPLQLSPLCHRTLTILPPPHPRQQLPRAGGTFWSHHVCGSSLAVHDSGPAFWLPSRAMCYWNVSSVSTRPQ